MYTLIAQLSYSNWQRYAALYEMRNVVDKECGATLARFSFALLDLPDLRKLRLSALRYLRQALDLLRR